MIWPLYPDQRPCETCFRGLEAGNAWRVTGEAARGSKYEVLLIVLSMYCASPPIAKILFIISNQEGVVALVSDAVALSFDRLCVFGALIQLWSQSAAL